VFPSSTNWRHLRAPSEAGAATASNASTDEENTTHWAPKQARTAPAPGHCSGRSCCGGGSDDGVQLSPATCGSGGGGGCDGGGGGCDEGCGDGGGGVGGGSGGDGGVSTLARLSPAREAELVSDLAALDAKVAGRRLPAGIRPSPAGEMRAAPPIGGGGGGGGGGGDGGAGGDDGGGDGVDDGVRALARLSPAGETELFADLAALDAKDEAR